uniref:Uncharacterized protein n=1 Tax=Leersia perrieri TaxID=77586 RepID=A0A0D9X646_9ORYZ
MQLAIVSPIAIGVYAGIAGSVADSGMTMATVLIAMLQLIAGGLITCLMLSKYGETNKVVNLLGSWKELCNYPGQYWPKIQRTRVSAEQPVSGGLEGSGPAIMLAVIVIHSLVEDRNSDQVAAFGL